MAQDSSLDTKRGAARASSLLLELIDVVGYEMQRFPDDRTVVLRRVAQLGGQERQLLPDLLGDFCLDFGIRHKSVSPFAAGTRFELEPGLEAFISQRSPRTEAAHRRQVERAWITRDPENARFTAVARKGVMGASWPPGPLAQY